MATKFSPDMSMVLAFSKEEAERLNNGSVTPSHILLAMLRHKENSAVSVLQKLNIDLQVLKRRLEESTQDNRLLIAPSIIDMDFDLTASRVIRLGALEARLMHSESIDTIHLQLAILKANDCQASNIMSEMNVTYASLAQIAHNNKEQKNREDNENKKTDEEAVVEYVTPEVDSPVACSTPRNTSSDTQTPLLDNFGTDLTKAAQENLLDPVVGRENEIERVAQILCRRKKNNPILIGEPGCGKSAIVEGLAQLIVKHRISRSLWDKRIVMLDMACVVAGTKYRGQFEERIRSISNELKNNPNVIVFIDEIHTIVGAGNAEGSMDAANILKPSLARGEFQSICATTTDER